MKLPKHFTLIAAGAVIALALGACRQASTPNGSLKAACTAVKNKDVPAYKKMLSKGKLALYEEQAKQSNIPVDDLLKQYLALIVCPEPFPDGKERIEGSTATLEMKNASTNENEKYRFVMEDGEWKLD